MDKKRGGIIGYEPEDPGQKSIFFAVLGDLSISKNDVGTWGIAFGTGYLGEKLFKNVRVGGKGKLAILALSPVLAEKLERSLGIEKDETVFGFDRILLPC